MPEVRLSDGRRVRVENVYGVGRNYADHARELGNEVPAEPFFFMKSTSSLWHGAGPLPLPLHRGPIHHEVEMVVLVGRPGPFADPVAGRRAVQAAGVGLDLTLRELQADLKAKGLPWTLAKSFAGAAAVGDLSAVGPDEPLDDLPVTLHVGGELRQVGRTSQMLHGAGTLLAYLSQRIPLMPGDLLFTGTPAGVGPVRDGDRLRGVVGELPVLDVVVRAAEAAGRGGSS